MLHCVQVAPVENSVLNLVYGTYPSANFAPLVGNNRFHVKVHVCVVQKVNMAIKLESYQNSIPIPRNQNAKHAPKANIPTKRVDFLCRIASCVKWGNMEILWPLKYLMGVRTVRLGDG